MVALSNSLVLPKTPVVHFSSGSSLKSVDKSISATKLLFSPRHGEKSSSFARSLTVEARYSDGGRPSSASIFVDGFVLGGVVAGALACIFAPQISKALAEMDKEELMRIQIPFEIKKKQLMRKLPKFIYDEEKALEKKRKTLQEKIDKLNAAIDEIAAKQSSPKQNGNAVKPNGVKTAS